MLLKLRVEYIEVKRLHSLKVHFVLVHILCYIKPPA